MDLILKKCASHQALMRFSKNYCHKKYLHQQIFPQNVCLIPLSLFFHFCLLGNYGVYLFLEAEFD